MVDPGRFELLHVKDEIEIQSNPLKYESIILGKGVAQVKDVLDLVKDSKVKFLFVEQENYQGQDPMACAKEDFEVMKKWGY